MLLGSSPLADMLGLPVRNWNQAFVRARQWRRWGTHGCPALGVGSTVEPRKYGWAVPSPRGARRGSVSCRQWLGFWLVLHGLHLILLCAAPEAMQKDENQWVTFSHHVTVHVSVSQKIHQQQQLKQWSISASLENQKTAHILYINNKRRKMKEKRENSHVKIICKHFWLHAPNL